MAGARIVPLFIPHLGCPCQCVFCNQRVIAGQTQPVTPSDVSHAVEQAQGKGAGKLEIAFYGGSFTAIPIQQQRALLDEAQRCIDAGLAHSIRLSTRPDCANEETLSFLKGYSVQVIEIGAQSLDDAVLSISKRGHTAQDTLDAAERIRGFGFSLVLQLMLGLPGSTRESDRKSIARAAKLKPDGMRFYPAVVLPGTELYDMWQTGEYSPLSIEDAAERCADGFEISSAAGIPVYRTGLQAEEGLADAVAAGPYHPAFGELAWNAYYCRLMRRALAGCTGKRGTAVLQVLRGAVSKAAGQKRRNLLLLAEEFPGVRLKITEGEVGGVKLVSFTENQL